MRTRHLAFALLLSLCIVNTTCDNDENDKTDIITFEELPLGTEGFWNGSDRSGGFISGNAFFPNQFTDWGGGIISWSGFAYSNHTDTITPGYVNQYSSFAGSGAKDSEKYAVIYGGDTLAFTIPEILESISVSNNTYAALSMRDGDAFAKRFGGETGDDPDWFALIITIIDEMDNVTGTDTVFLADYRFENRDEDYIEHGWIIVPFDFPGVVKKLVFRFASTDTGDFGINTPAYACIDNLQGTLAD